MLNLFYYDFGVRLTPDPNIYYRTHKKLPEFREFFNAPKQIVSSVYVKNSKVSARQKGQLRK